MPIDYAGRGDPARTLALLWKTHERPTRGPKPGLSVDQIVATAITLADTEGLDAVSMRRIASELGVGTMTLYRYVPSKSELLDVMLDASAAEDPVQIAVSGDLRATLEHIAHSAWAYYHRHPWILQVAIARPVLGPNTLRGFDAALGTLTGLGLSYAQSVATLQVIDGFVRGTARESVEAAQAERVTGISDEEWWSERDWFWERFFDPATFPTISKYWDSGESSAVTIGPTNVFEFGLARLLDGFDGLDLPGPPPPGDPGHGGDACKCEPGPDASGNVSIPATAPATDPATDE